ncbi:MAG TPA: hypothetical protein VKF35_19045 [Hyphomicrobiaceae bacterium]|jgi:hypothetical protein|nr:hypothetical protein [Hyphomicrobiaceae bacterium]
MGIEALNNAARAAGFAMAAPDDTPDAEVVRGATEAGWQSGASLPVRTALLSPQVARPSPVADWFRAMLPAGRGAPAGAR